MCRYYYCPGRSVYGISQSKYKVSQSVYARSFCFECFNLWKDKVSQSVQAMSFFPEWLSFLFKPLIVNQNIVSTAASGDTNERVTGHECVLRADGLRLTWNAYGFSSDGGPSNGGPSDEKVPP
jgi:hypothetical protein